MPPFSQKRPLPSSPTWPEGRWSPLESLRVGGSKVGGNRGILMASFRQEWGGTVPLCGKKGRLSFLWHWNWFLGHLLFQIICLGAFLECLLEWRFKISNSIYSNTSYHKCNGISNWILGSSLSSVGTVVKHVWNYFFWEILHKILLLSRNLRKDCIELVTALNNAAQWVWT